MYLPQSILTLQTMEEMYAIRDIVMSPSYQPSPDIPITSYRFIITKISKENPTEPALPSSPHLSHTPRSVPRSVPRTAPQAVPHNVPHSVPHSRFSPLEASESEEIVEDWEMPEEDAADFDLSVGSTVSLFPSEPSNATLKSPRICSLQKKKPRDCPPSRRLRTRAFQISRLNGSY